jgi:hypothetical protein
MGMLMVEKPFWEHPVEKKAHQKHLSEKQIKSAKAKARAHGRPYPNLVDNVAAMRKKKG